MGTGMGLAQSHSTGQRRATGQEKSENIRFKRQGESGGGAGGKGLASETWQEGGLGLRA